jgi:hypothetical protein
MDNVFVRSTEELDTEHDLETMQMYNNEDISLHLRGNGMVPPSPFE